MTSFFDHQVIAQRMIILHHSFTLILTSLTAILQQPLAITYQSRFAGLASIDTLSRLEFRIWDPDWSVYWCLDKA